MLFRAPDASMSQKIDAGRNIILLNERTVASFDEPIAQSLFALFVKNGLGSVRLLRCCAHR